ncbi:MAG: hypothetical protein OXK80_01425 [Bdellovibrionales bacterium]|nr:hypothetical protein [Bdellovibrionales bacterium]
MKHLSVLIILFFSIGAVEAQQPLPSGYGKHSLYSYLVEPLVSLDENWGHLITHCSVVEENVSQVVQTYDGLGSCIFEQIEMLSDEEKLQRNIVFHAKAGDQSFDLLFQWTGLSVQDVLSSYFEKNPHKLSSQMTLDLLSGDKPLSDALSYLILSEMFKTSPPEDRHTFQQASEFLLQKTIDAIHLSADPYAEGLLQVTLSFLDSHNVEFYKLEAITNYYIGAEEYFVTSIDQYQEKTNEK